VVELQPTTGKVLGTFNNGWPGLVHARYGKGQVYLFGTYLGGAVNKGLLGAAEVLTVLAESASAANRPHCVGSEVRVDILSAGKGRLVVANSLSNLPLTETLVLPRISGQALVDIVSGERFALSQESHGMHAQVSFAPLQVRAMDVAE
jgi:hypothetical protein